MSTANIVGIQPSGLSVLVTFRTHGGGGSRTYQYFDLEAVRGILAGEDPAQWSGTEVDGSSGGAATTDTIGSAIGEIGELGGEIGLL